MGIFNNPKPLLKTKIKNRDIIQVLLHYTVYSLYLFLIFILIMQDNLYQVSSRLIKNVPAFLQSYCCFSLKMYDLSQVALKKTPELSIHL